jgi:hypothetical protein
MRSAVVMDTNVAVVANGHAPQAGFACVRSCIRTLLHLRAERRLLIDRTGLILREYRTYLSPTGQPGVGDAFFKWLWNNQANPQLCRQIPLTPLDEDHRRFVEFPDDPDLASFDPSDQKFVAVALASEEQPPILQAVDSKKWRLYQDALIRHHVQVQFICPE